MAKDPATSFDEMIKAGRLRKKNEALANQIFGKGRSGSGMVSRKASSTPPSLASRIGVTKRTVSATTKSNIDDKWSHDLHHKNNPHASRVSQLPLRHSSARITRDNRLYAALQSDVTPNSVLDNQINIRGAANGISIRGSAGPYAVLASNFAPGTTAADIRSALEQHVTDIISCIVLSAAPTVIAEIVFQQRNSAETVIATFNNQLADGRTLHVHLKNGPPTIRPKPTPTGPRAGSGATQRERAETERRATDVDMQDDSYRPNEERRDRSNRGERGLYSDRYNERYKCMEPDTCGEEWSDEQLEAALKRLDEMHRQLRTLRTTIPRMIKPLTTPHDSPEELYRDFARAAETADKEVKEFRRFRNDKKSREVLERAGTSSNESKDGITPWKVTENPDAFDAPGDEADDSVKGSGYGTGSVQKEP